MNEVSRGRVYLSTGFGENVVALNDLSEAALDEVEVGGAVEFACVIGEYERDAISMTQCGPAQHGADNSDASGETFIVSNKFTIIRLPDAMGGDIAVSLSGEPPIAGGGAADLGEPYEADQLIAAAQQDMDAYEADWLNKRVNVIGTVDEASRRRIYLSAGFGENAVALEDLANAALEEIEVGETVEFACVIGEYAREAVHMTQCGPAEHGADNAGAGGESDATAIIANSFIVIGDEAYISLTDPDNPQNLFWVQSAPADIEAVTSFLTWFETGAQYEFTPSELVGTEDLNGEETRRLRGAFVVQNLPAGTEQPDNMETDVWVGTSDNLIRKIAGSGSVEDAGMGLEITISYSRFDDSSIQIERPTDFIAP